MSKPFDSAAEDIQFRLARCIGKIEFRVMGQGEAAKKLLELLGAEGLQLVPTGSLDHIASMPYRKDDPRTY